MILRAIDWIKTFIEDALALQDYDVFNLAMECHGGFDKIDLQIAEICRLEHEKRWSDYHHRWSKNR